MHKNKLRTLKLNTFMCFIVKKNKHNEFFTLDGILEEENSGFYNGTIFSQGVHFQEYAICIWPIKDGYARFIGKNGNWGFLHGISLEPFWLDSQVLYAEDFNCGLARIQYVDGTYNYLNNKLQCLNEVNFIKASDFKDGKALVSDCFCDDFQIDVNGEVVEEDKKRHHKGYINFLRDEWVDENEERKKETRRVIDPESAVMSALIGMGGNPEDFGF